MSELEQIVQQKVFEIGNLQTLFPFEEDNRASVNVKVRCLKSFIHHECWERHSQPKMLFTLSFFGYYFLDKGELGLTKDDLYKKVERHYERNRAYMERNLSEEELSTSVYDRIQKIIEDWRRNNFFTDAGVKDEVDGRVALFTVSASLKKELNDFRRELTERKQGRFFGNGNKPALLSYMEEHSDKFQTEVSVEDVAKKLAVNQQKQTALKKEEKKLSQDLEKIKQGKPVSLNQDEVDRNDVQQFFLGLTEELTRREENAEYIKKSYERITEAMIHEVNKSDISRGAAILKSFEESDLLKSTPESQEITRLKRLVPKNIFDSKEDLELFKAMLDVVYRHPLVKEMVVSGEVHPKRYYLDFIFNVLGDRLDKIERVREKGIGKINNIIANFSQLQSGFGQELKDFMVNLLERKNDCIKNDVKPELSFQCAKFGIEPTIFTPIALNLYKKEKKPKKDIWENDNLIVDDDFSDLEEMLSSIKIQTIKDKLTNKLTEVLQGQEVVLFTDLVKELAISADDFWLFWQLSLDAEFLRVNSFQFRDLKVEDKVVKTIIKLPKATEDGQPDFEIYSIEQFELLKLE